VNFTPTIGKMIETDPDSDDYVAGTEKTGNYAKILDTDLGLVAFRLTGGYVRVRVEPANTEAAEKLAEKLTRSTGWKQPGDSGENRFSKMFHTSGGAVRRHQTKTSRLPKTRFGRGRVQVPTRELFRACALRKCHTGSGFS
jgi:hypothetical protein